MSTVGSSPCQPSCPTCCKIAANTTYCGAAEECQNSLSAGLCVGIAILMVLIFVGGLLGLYFGFRNRSIDN